MATTNLQRAALEALVEHLAAAVPDLADRGGSAFPDEEVAAALPWFRVVPGFLAVEFYQGADDEVDVSEAAADEEGNPGRIVVEVGQLAGEVAVHLATRNGPERERLEAAILAALAGDDDRRGVTVLRLEDVETAGGVILYEPAAAFDLAGDGWRDEFAATKERRAVLNLTAQIPILVDREVAGTIDTLALFVARDPSPDLDTDPDDLVYDAIVEVDEAGNLDPFEP